MNVIGTTSNPQEWHKLKKCFIYLFFKIRASWREERSHYLQGTVNSSFIKKFVAGRPPSLGDLGQVVQLPDPQFPHL